LKGLVYVIRLYDLRISHVVQHHRSTSVFLQSPLSNGFLLKGKLPLTEIIFRINIFLIESLDIVLLLKNIQGLQTPISPIVFTSSQLLPDEFLFNNAKEVGRGPSHFIPSRI